MTVDISNVLTYFNFLPLKKSGYTKLVKEMNYQVRTFKLLRITKCQPRDDNCLIFFLPYLKSYIFCNTNK